MHVILYQSHFNNETILRFSIVSLRGHTGHVQTRVNTGTACDAVLPLEVVLVRNCIGSTIAPTEAQADIPLSIVRP